MNLNGKVALVTGGSRGIGRAIALKLASSGAKIIINYERNEEAAKNVIEEIKALGSDGIAIQCNIADSKSCEEMIKKAADTFEKIDILVNNAGITNDKLMLRMSEEDFMKVIDVNLKGAFNCTKYVSAHMIRKKVKGKIVNISSVVGVSGNAGQVNYAAAKAGIIGLTKSVAKELGSKGICVNAVAPGFIQTDMTNVLKDDLKESVTNLIPLKRFGKPEEVAELVAFLSSPSSDYITSQVIKCDGGMLM